MAYVVIDSREKAADQNGPYMLSGSAISVLNWPTEAEKFQVLINFLCLQPKEEK